MKAEKPSALLLHEWSYELYGKQEYSDSKLWPDVFLSTIRNIMSCHLIVFPGFLDVEEPDKASWHIEDFANHVNNFLSLHTNVEYIIGFSFGGAVAVKYKEMYSTAHKLILISPAILRKPSRKSVTINKTIKYLMPKNITLFLRHIYLSYIVKNKYHSLGSNFVRNSYRNIVTTNLINELRVIPYDDMVIIFGKDDILTPPKLLTDKIKNEIRLLSRIFILNNCGHYITRNGNDDLFNVIRSFVSFNNK